MFTILFNGDETNFNSINDVIKFLNEALYYASEVYIFEPLTFDPIEYSNLEPDDLVELFEDVETYNLKPLQVVQTFE